jgi:esterase/lipase
MQKRGVFFGAATPPLEARHHASGLNSLFNGDQLSFADYVSQSRGMIRKIRSATNPDYPDQACLDKALDGNAPFELKPSGTDSAGKEKPWRRGILLTHGLSDSPYFMRYLAACFQENGFRVMVVLLPGHGTQPGDLLDVSWKEWARAVAYGTDRLAAEVDEVYLGGYSAGGALSIYQSLQDKRVRGLFLFAPALEITRKAAYACLHKLVSWLIPRTKWVYIKPDNDIYKYESFAKNTATQMYQLTLAVNARLKLHELNIPIFAVASADDKTVKTPATVEFMAQQSHPSNKLILYTTEATKLVKSAPAEKIEWVNSVVPAQKILSSAHTAILIPAEDEHYGIDGNYANCAHYYPENMEKYEACKRHPEEYCLGEVTEKNLQAGILRRLMYNPSFPALKASLLQFIDGLQ